MHGTQNVLNGVSMVVRVMERPFIRLIPGDEFIGLPFSAFVAPGGEILALLSGELQPDTLLRLFAEMDAVASGQRSATEARERLSAD